MLVSQTRSKITSLQSIMDIIQLEFGTEAVQHILKQCNQVADGGNHDSPAVARSVSSESDHMLSSHSSDDGSSLGCFKV